MHRPNKISRRSFVGKMVTFGAGIPYLPKFASGDVPTSATLHEKVAHTVAELLSGSEATLRIFYPEGCLSNVEPVAQAFQKQTGVRIEFIMTGVDTINSKILLSTAGEQYDFDIAIPATFGIPDLVEAGALTDLTAYAHKYAPPILQKNALFSTGDFYKNAFYGYQTDGDTYMMFYNKSWLDDEHAAKRFADQQGYPLKIPETWEELDTMMAFFHHPEKGQYGGCLFRTADYLVWEWWIRLHAKGHYPVTNNMVPQINGEAGLAALEELIKATEYQHPSAKMNGLFDNWKVYAEGQCFANIGWGGTQKYLRSDKSQMRNNMKFGLTPGGRKRGKLFKTPYFNWGWNYVVSRYSTNPELAYLFTLYASTPEMSSISVRQADGYFDPFRSEHYADPTIQETYGQDFLKTHQESMSVCIPDFYMSGYNEYFGALRENLFLALTGVLRPQLALDAAANEWETITQKKGRQQQIEQWRFLQSLYPENAKRCLS